MSRTVISTARDVIGSARTVISSSRADIGVYRVPQLYRELGLTSVWDFRTGYLNTDSRMVVDVIGGYDINLYTGSPATVYTTGEYTASLASASSEYFKTNDRVRTKTSALTKLTVFGWYRTISNSVQNIIAHWIPTNPGRGWQMRRLNAANNNALEAIITGATGAEVIIYDANTVFTINTWVFAAYTYDAATTTMTMYKDGASVSNSLVSGTPGTSISNNISNIFVGATGDASGNPTVFANGKIGICGFANDAVLTAAQVDELYKFTGKVMGIL